MTRPGTVPLHERALSALWARFGGEGNAPEGHASALAAIEVAESADLSLCASPHHLAAAAAAHARGALLLVNPELAARLPAERVWRHRHAGWVFAELLAASAFEPQPARIPASARIEPGAMVLPGVVLGEGVRIGAGSVIGRSGFGFVPSPSGALREVPHLGGVHIADQVWIGAYCTIDAGVLLPTRIGADSKLDSHVHVGHNVVLGARVRVAAQAGFAGSVRVGDDVQIGGQAGIADHVSIGAGARIAAKAGVIGAVPAGATFAGYPAVPRQRWLRGHARLYRSVR